MPGKLRPCFRKAMGLIGNDGTHRIVFKLFASAKEIKFDKKSDFQNLRADLLEQARGCGCSATRGQKIINQQYAAAGFDGIDTPI